MSKAYSARLADPRWAAKRREILTRDGFACTQCGKTGGLHVHHLAYTGEPWEAPNEDLITLCVSCHRKVHAIPNSVRAKIPLRLSYVLTSQYAMKKATKLMYDSTGVFIFLACNVERENLVRMRTTLIAKELDISVATVERHMRKLRELNLIEPDAAEGDKKTAIFNWRVCPFLAWSGHTNELAQYVEKLPNDHPWWEYAEPAVRTRYER